MSRRDKFQKAVNYKSKGHLSQRKRRPFKKPLAARQLRTGNKRHGNKIFSGLKECFLYHATNMSKKIRKFAFSQPLAVTCTATHRIQRHRGTAPRRQKA